MSRKLLVLAAILFLAGATSATLAAGPGPGTCTSAWCTGNPDCPDSDSDGICNGQDPDYVPPATNPTCPDADGDGICNGRDPDFVPQSGTGSFARMCNTLSWVLGQLLL